MQIVTGRRGEPHVTSRQMQAVYRSFLGDFALLDVGNHLAATATAIDNVRISDGVVAVQGIYAVIAYNEYDDNYIEPVSVGMKRIDTLILHYTKSNDIEDMQIEVVEGEEVVDNPVAPTIAEGGDAWEGTADIKVPIYDVLVTSFGLTVTPYSRMNTLIPTLDSIAERIPAHIVSGVKGDSEVLYRYGNVNLTKDNIGLGNVDNTSDTDKPVSTATQTALNAGLAGKVDKVAGKGLSTEDYTTTDKTKLAGISEGATQTIANPADTATETLSKLKVGGVVYDVPQGTTGATNLSELNDVNLSGTVEGDILEYDSTANKWKNSNALQGSKTTTGNPLTITDAAPVNAVNVSVDLEPIQAGSGTPSPDNIRPISGRSEVAIQRVGKNKCPLLVQGAWNIDGTYTQDTNRVRTESMIDVTVGSNYIFSCANSSVLYLCQFFDSNLNYVGETSWTNLGDYISVPQNVRKSTIIFRNATNTNITPSDITQPQFELGTQSTPYEPYKGKTYTIQIGETIYGGELDVLTGELRVDTAIVNPTTVSSKSSSTTNDGYYLGALNDAKAPSSISELCGIICNEFEEKSTEYLYRNDAYGVTINTNKELYIFLGKGNVTTISQANTWLSNNPLQVYYELATPYTIQLTPQQIRLLKGTNNISCNTGDLSIKYYPDNVLGQLKGDIEKGLNAYYDYQIQALWDKIGESQA